MTSCDRNIVVMSHILSLSFSISTNIFCLVHMYFFATHITNKKLWFLDNKLVPFFFSFFPAYQVFVNGKWTEEDDVVS